MTNAIRLVRYSVPAQQPRLGIVCDDQIFEIAPIVSSFEELVKLANGKNLFQFAQTLKKSTHSYFYKNLDCIPNKTVPYLLMPVVPAEVWGAGVT